MAVFSNPSFEAVNSYPGPGGSLGNLYTPSSFVWVVYTAPVRVSTTLISTPATVPPLISVITPVRAATSCACARLEKKKRQSNTAQNTHRFRIILATPILNSSTCARSCPVLLKTHSRNDRGTMCTLSVTFSAAGRLGQNKKRLGPD